MLARAVLFASLVTAAGCGHPSTPAAPAPPAPPASTSFVLDGAPWTIAVAGTVAADGEYDQKLTTAGFELTLSPWPRSEAFVETLGQHLDGARQDNPSLEVVHQVDGGEYAFEAVLATGGAIDGTVLVPDPAGGDGAMCGFKLAAGADWHPALAACASIAPAGE